MTESQFCEKTQGSVCQSKGHNGRLLRQPLVYSPDGVRDPTSLQFYPPCTRSPLILSFFCQTPFLLTFSIFKNLMRLSGQLTIYCQSLEPVLKLQVTASSKLLLPNYRRSLIINKLVGSLYCVYVLLLVIILLLCLLKCSIIQRFAIVNVSKVLYK